jgi:hypothetical protein
MITIFGHYDQFSAKKIGDSLVNQRYDQVLAFNSSFLSQLFSNFFAQNIFKKLITSTPEAIKVCTFIRQSGAAIFMVSKVISQQ